MAHIRRITHCNDFKTALPTNSSRAELQNSIPFSVAVFHAGLSWNCVPLLPPLGRKITQTVIAFALFG
jgi:hypothetical protein